MSPAEKITMSQVLRFLKMAEQAAERLGGSRNEELEDKILDIILWTERLQRQL